ncbi:MAG: hypothetical protein LHV68_06860 [Elusimicrobia bacterium]|nr:hypothetical protein [Candidatus Liberimonas magnetica]
MSKKQVRMASSWGPLKNLRSALAALRRFLYCLITGFEGNPKHPPRRDEARVPGEEGSREAAG